MATHKADANENVTYSKYSICQGSNVRPYFGGGASNTNDQIQQIQQIAATWTIETQIRVEIQGQAD